MNFFTEYHGKSLVDGHFGTLTRWLNEAILEKNIKSIKDLIESFREKENNRQSNFRANKYRKISKQNYKYFFLSIIEKTETQF